MSKFKPALKAFLGATALTAAASVAQADIVHLDDVIIDGSLCVGFDCVNGEAFGFDTIKLKENNVRIKFDDTSTSASFPNRDWQLTANASSNGGANKFSIDDITGGRTPFTIEAAAPSNALYVDDGGRVGLGTATPVTDIHAVSGNTPTLRLEQDGSSGFAPQTFDVAANETNFFIRDATNGSTLPFRIKPGAPTNAIFVAADGDVGMGAGTSPQARLHVRDTAGSGATNMLHLENNGNPQVIFENTAVSREWEFGAGLNFVIEELSTGGGTNAMTISPGGDMTLAGDLTLGGTCIQLDTLACTFSAGGGASCSVASCP